MARLARAVMSGAPHHVTQKSKRRKIFFGDDDYRLYKSLVAEGCAAAKVKVLAYAMEKNQVHLILVPRDEDGLRAALGEAHRRYAWHINAREGWHGLLWQARFSSFPIDDDWLRR